MTPSDSPAQPRSLAPHHRRLFALLLDLVVLVLVLPKLLSQLATEPGWDLRLVTEATTGPSWSYVATVIVLLLVKDSLGGRSPGKWLLGIRVTRRDDPTVPAGPLQCILRNALLVLLPVEAVLVFTDRYMRRLGDYAAGTVVVVPARLMAPGRRMLMGAGGFFALVLAGFLLTTWNARRSAAYDAAFQAARTDPHLREAVGGTPELSWSLALRVLAAEGRAQVGFDAEGDKGSAEAVVHLRLAPSGGRWEVERVAVDPEDETDAPPAPIRPEPAPAPPRGDAGDAPGE